MSILRTLQEGGSFRCQTQANRPHPLLSTISPGELSDHNNQQHAIQWELYQFQNEKEKKEFFNKAKTTTMHRVITKCTDELEFVVSSSIVDKIIGDMFFQVNGDDGSVADDIGITIDQTMNLFVKQNDGSFKVIIKNVKRFTLALQHVSVGSSFQQTTTVIDQHKAAFTNAQLVGLNDHLVSKFVRVSVAVNLHIISTSSTMILCGCFRWPPTPPRTALSHISTSAFDCVRVVYSTTCTLWSSLFMIDTLVRTSPACYAKS